MIAMQAQAIGTRRFMRRPATDVAPRRVSGQASEDSPTSFESSVPQGWAIYRAVTREDLLASYHFMCRIREGLGYPRPALTPVWAGATGTRREVATFLAKSWPDVVGTASLIVDSWDSPLPAERTFPEVCSLRRRGSFLCEVTHRAMVPAYHRTPVPDDLLRCCVAHGLFVGCTDLLVVAKPWERERFLRFGFDQASPIRSSGGAVPESTALLRLDMSSLVGGGASPSRLRRFYLQQNPYRRYVKAWSHAAEKGLRVSACVAGRAPVNAALTTAGSGPPRMLCA